MKKSAWLLTTVAMAVAQAGFGQDPVVLTVAQSPPLLADAGLDTRIDKGTSVTIGGVPSASLGYGQYVYLWTPADGLDDPTLANPSATPGTTTTYLLTVTDALNCTASDEVTVSVDASGVENFPSGLKVICYPNPVEDHLRIEMGGITSDLVIRLVSPLGKELVVKVSRTSGPSAVERIPMRDLPAGVYYLQVISDETTIFHPILKTRQP